MLLRSISAVFAAVLRNEVSALVETLFASYIFLYIFIYMCVVEILIFLNLR
jgi:hypothetical protein